MDPDPGDPKRPDPTGSGSATLFFYPYDKKVDPSMIPDPG